MIQDFVPSFGISQPFSSRGREWPDKGLVLDSNEFDAVHFKSGNNNLGEVSEGSVIPLITIEVTKFKCINEYANLEGVHFSLR